MILLALAMAVTVEGLIEYLKTVGKAVLEKAWKTAATQGCALALGIALVLGALALLYGVLVAWLLILAVYYTVRLM